MEGNPPSPSPEAGRHILAVEPLGASSRPNGEDDEDHPRGRCAVMPDLRRSGCLTGDFDKGRAINR